MAINKYKKPTEQADGTALGRTAEAQARPATNGIQQSALTGGANVKQQAGNASAIVAGSAPAQGVAGQPAQMRRPGDYQYANQADLEAMYQAIANRGPFQFDLNSNPFWQQYKDQYISAGQMAMQDTMGQAAALTGGYGSSYGQAVGQQAYNKYLQDLNQIVPQLYEQERAAYDAEGDRMMQLYGLAADRENQAYNRYMDNYNRWWNESQAAQQQANWQAQFDYGREQDAQNQANWQAQFDYGREQDAQSQANWQAQFDWQQQVDQRDYDFSREQWDWQKGNSGRSGGGDGSDSYRTYDEPYEAPTDEPEKTDEPTGNGSSNDAGRREMTFVGGYSESDIGSIVKTYYDRYLVGKAGSLEDFLRSVGVTNTDAIQYAKQVFQYAVQTYGGPGQNYRGGR